MTDLDPLILDFLEWLSIKPRRYADVMDVWRTSCPRLTVWEDAIDRGLVTRGLHKAEGPVIELTDDGRGFLLGRRTPVALGRKKELHQAR